MKAVSESTLNNISKIATAIKNDRVQRLENLKENYLGKSSDFIKQVNNEFIELLQASIITNATMYGTTDVHIDEVICNFEIAFDLVSDKLKGGDNIECTRSTPV